MYAVPDVDEVVAVAKELGIHLSPDEAVKYREYLTEQMGQLDTFVQARLEEPKPPMVSSARKPGYRPSPEEDPLNAWMWKCRIEGAAEGLLAGKTVSYKDHIAVAHIPMSFGSFALEGFIPDFDATVVTRVLKEGGTIIGKNVMNGLSGGFGTGGGIGDYGRPLNPHNQDPPRAPPRPWPPARWTSLSAATRAAPSASRRLSPASSDTSPRSDCCRTSGSDSARTRASTTRAR